MSLYLIQLTYAKLFAEKDGFSPGWFFRRSAVLRHFNNETRTYKGNAMLVIFSGLPGTGKTTLARALATDIKAVFLRIDSLENALAESGLVENINDIGPAGYMAAYALAADNLRLGLSVVADSVNPFAITRDAWRDVALKCGKAYLEIEVRCSDAAEHRRRVECRRPDLPGFVLPTWVEVVNREYSDWDRDHLILDTARLTVAQALAAINDHMQNVTAAC